MKSAFTIAGLFGLLAAAPAFADEAADVSRLLKAGQYAAGIAKADAYLAQRPRDAQMRFLKGVLLTEMNKPAEAIQIFTKLTEDFPDLPEPHNNLAVLYASSGQFDKARASLDMAIRTNPSYATAYENLGDVHAKLASQAYDKAFQLDSRNSAAKSKLTLLMNLASKEAPAVVKATVPAVTPAAAPAAAAVAVQPAKPAAPVVVAQAAPPASTAIKPAAPAAAAPAPAPKPPAKPVDRDDAEVMKTVNGWAKAWSERDVKDYLNFYANDFQTPGGVPRKAWVDERTARIQGKGRISVEVLDPDVKVDGNTATVTFRQVYVSDRLKANSRKTLVLVKQGKQWQIKQERTGS